MLFLLKLLFSCTPNQSQLRITVNSIPFNFDASKVPLMEYILDPIPVYPSAPTPVGKKEKPLPEVMEEFFTRQQSAYTQQPDHYTPMAGAVLVVECEEEQVEQHRAFLYAHCPYAKSIEFVRFGQGRRLETDARSSFHNKYGGLRISAQKQAIFIPFLQEELAKGPAKIMSLVERAKEAGIVEAAYFTFYQALHIMGAVKVRAGTGNAREVYWGLAGSAVKDPMAIDEVVRKSLDTPKTLNDIRSIVCSTRGKDISPKRLRLVLEGLGAKEIPAGAKGAYPVWRLETSVEKEAAAGVPGTISEIRTRQAPAPQLSFLDTVGQVLPGLEPSFDWKDE